jgi:carbon monoxide dehydrogenase subunit G
MQLEPQDGSTKIVMHTDASVLGKLGEFGQAVMRRKADQILQEFGRNLSRELSQDDAAVRATA